MTGWTPEACRLSGTLASEIKAQERRSRMRVVGRDLCPDCSMPNEVCDCEAARADRAADQKFDEYKNGDREDFVDRFYRDWVLP